MPDTVCLGTSRLYHVNDTAIHSRYSWKIDGILQNSITNTLSVTWNTPGQYLISVQEHSANGCEGDIRSGMVYVKQPPVPNAGNDIKLCFGTNEHLIGSGGVHYHWSPSTYLSNPNISDPVIKAPNAGVYTYFLDVSDANGCKSLQPASVNITILQPVKIFAGNDTSIARNQALQLNVVDLTNSDIKNFSWSPSIGLNNSFISNPVASLTSDIIYVVTARTAEGCEATDDIKIKVFAQADLLVPSAFTPNGDGLNDVLKVIPVGIKELKFFNVYNRWGELVFTTKDYNKGWDGKVFGKPQSTFTFVWAAEGIDYKGNIIMRKGIVTLIR
jgi:gliding motility-associated-like protein